MQIMNKIKKYISDCESAENNVRYIIAEGSYFKWEIKAQTPKADLEKNLKIMEWYNWHTPFLNLIALSGIYPWLDLMKNPLPEWFGTSFIAFVSYFSLVLWSIWTIAYTPRYLKIEETKRQIKKILSESM